MERLLTLRSSAIAEALRRPYPVNAPMVVLMLLVPVYIFIPEFLGHRALHVPATPLDARIPLQPAWALVYGSLYLFVILPFLMRARGSAPATKTRAGVCLSRALGGATCAARPFARAGEWSGRARLNVAVRPTRGTCC